MTNKKIVLASQSPRRKQLLEQIGLQNFEIRKSEYGEDMTLQKEPTKLAEFLALQKAKDVARHYKEAIIVSGDSMLFRKDDVYGKAKTREDAVKMLQFFSGKEIGCVSGLAIIDIENKKEIITHGVAWLQFRELSLDEIEHYVKAEKDILGVAGGFNVLSKGAILIESIRGDFYSVVGFPLVKVYLGLKEVGVNILENNK